MRKRDWGGINFRKTEKGKNTVVVESERTSWSEIGFTGSEGSPFELGGKKIIVVLTCLVELLPPARFSSSGAGTEIMGNTSKWFGGQQVN